MAARRSDNLPSQMNKVDVYEDELPKTPKPLIPKRIVIDDISDISEICSEADNGSFHQECRRNYPRDPASYLHSNGIQKVPKDRGDSSNVSRLPSRRAINRHLPDVTSCQCISASSGTHKFQCTSPNRSGSPTAECTEHCFQPGYTCKEIMQNKFEMHRRQNVTSDNCSVPGTISSCNCCDKHQSKTLDSDNSQIRNGSEKMEGNASSPGYNKASKCKMVHFHHEDEDSEPCKLPVVNGNPQFSNTTEKGIMGTNSNQSPNAFKKNSSNYTDAVPNDNVKQTSKTESLHCENKTSAEYNHPLKVDCVPSIDKGAILPSSPECNLKHSELKVPSEDANRIYENLDKKMDSLQEQFSSVSSQFQQFFQALDGWNSCEATRNTHPVFQIAPKESETPANINNCITLNNQTFLQYMLFQSQQMQLLQSQVNMLLLNSFGPTALNRSENQPIDSDADGATNAQKGAGLEPPKDARRIQNSQQFQLLQGQANMPLLNSICPTAFNRSENQPIVSDAKGATNTQEGTSPEAPKDTCRIQTSNVVHHEKSEVVTSTTTSWIMEGPEKVVVRKLETFTDVSKSHKEISSKGSFTKTPSCPEKQNAAKSKVSSSQKKKDKSRKSNKKSHDGTKKGPPSPNEAACDNVPVLQFSPDRKELNVTTPGEKRHEKETAGTNNAKAVPSYKSILRNVNELIVENSASYDHQSPPSNKKTTPNSAPGRRDKHTTKPKSVKSPSPTLHIKEPDYNDHLCRRQSRSPSASSDTSVDCVLSSPQYRGKRTSSDDSEQDSSPFSPADGLQSCVSFATQEYLERFGLCRDKKSVRKNNSCKESTPRFQKHPR